MTHSTVGDYMTLSAATEISISVFMEIAAKVGPIRNVIFRKGTLRDSCIFIGIPGVLGAITSIRVLSPIVAGPVAVSPGVGIAIIIVQNVARRGK